MKGQIKYRILSSKISNDTGIGWGRATFSLQTASDHLGVWLIKISRIERELAHDDEFVTIYRAWLNERIAA